MFHENRTWQIFDVSSSEELANNLVENTYVLCQAFQLDDLLFLNDSICVNSAQEYAVIMIDNSQCYQINSITFSWCDYSRALYYINKCRNHSYCRKFLVYPCVESSDEHSCYHCDLNEPNLRDIAV